MGQSMSNIVRLGRIRFFGVSHVKVFVRTVFLCLAVIWLGRFLRNDWTHKPRQVREERESVFLCEPAEGLIRSDPVALAQVDAACIEDDLQGQSRILLPGGIKQGLQLTARCILPKVVEQVNKGILRGDVGDVSIRSGRLVFSGLMLLKSWNLAA
jgi:hypothetical protein